jgi:CRISPR/Cas system-associated exonuclease Cas4 (RecB family)
MAKLPVPVGKLLIEEIIEGKTITTKPRPYFGISGIGEKCPRKLWYSFRWVADEEITPRQNRLFSRGHREEPIVITDLLNAGVSVHSSQITAVTGHGHIKGHPDGICEGVPDSPATPHLLEIKTANDANFKKMKTHGIKTAKPEYYAQVQCYMKLFKLRRTLFIVVNKNTDERYYERIKYSAKDATLLISRAIEIITTEEIPPKIGSKVWYECKWCKFYAVCQLGAEPNHNCRTCTHIEMRDEGVWACSLNGEWLPTAKQRKACKNYKMMHQLAQS